VSLHSELEPVFSMFVLRTTIRQNVNEEAPS
jgi:hypothetical protein